MELDERYVLAAAVEAREMVRGVLHARGWYATNQMAKFLDWTPSAVSNWMTGRSGGALLAVAKLHAMTNTVLQKFRPLLADKGTEPTDEVTEEELKKAWGMVRAAPVSVGPQHQADVLAWDGPCGTARQLDVDIVAGVGAGAGQQAKAAKAEVEQVEACLVFDPIFGPSDPLGARAPRLARTLQQALLAALGSRLDAPPALQKQDSGPASPGGGRGVKSAGSRTRSAGPLCDDILPPVCEPAPKRPKVGHVLAHRLLGINAFQQLRGREDRKEEGEGGGNGSGRGKAGQVDVRMGMARARAPRGASPLPRR
jgi:hypothetical protein